VYTCATLWSCRGRWSWTVRCWCGCRCSTDTRVCGSAGQTPRHATCQDLRGVSTTASQFSYDPCTGHTPSPPAMSSLSSLSPRVPEQNWWKQVHRSFTDVIRPTVTVTVTVRYSTADSWPVLYTDTNRLTCKKIHANRVTNRKTFYTNMFSVFFSKVLVFL